MAGRTAMVGRGGAVAAAALAVAVLGLFLRLQEYGPESAIRKFHQALVVGSAAQLQRVTLEDVTSPLVGEFAGRVQAILRSGGDRYRILRTDRTPSEVRAVVAYSLGNDAVTSMVWVVDRDGRTWRVNVGETARVMQDALGM